MYAGLKHPLNYTQKKIRKPVLLFYLNIKKVSQKSPFKRIQTEKILEILIDLCNFYNVVDFHCL